VVQTAEGKGVSAAAREHGVARSTVQRLARRYRVGGIEALCTKLREARPAIAQQVREPIVELKLALPSRSGERIQAIDGRAGSAGVPADGVAGAIGTRASPADKSRSRCAGS
jgi:transposase-like protein